MSREHYFDAEDGTSWNDDELRNKQRSKKIKQRRRDTKRRYYDEQTETQYLDSNGY